MASRLDGIGARLTAVALCLAALAFLAWYERDQLFPPAEETAQAEDPALAAYRACVSGRFADVNGMRADGVISEDQETLFKARAEAYCRAQHPPTQ